MKLRLSSVFEISKYLATNSGKELREALEYLSEFCQQVSLVLTEKLTYSDNFLCEIRQVNLISGLPATIVPLKTNRVQEIRIRRLISDQYYSWTEWGWKYGREGQILCKCTIAGSPTGVIPAEIIIYY